MRAGSTRTLCPTPNPLVRSSAFYKFLTTATSPAKSPAIAIDGVFVCFPIVKTENTFNVHIFSVAANRHNQHAALCCRYGALAPAFNGSADDGVQHTGAWMAGNSLGRCSRSRSKAAHSSRFAQKAGLAVARSQLAGLSVLPPQYQETQPGQCSPAGFRRFLMMRQFLPVSLSCFPYHSSIFVMLRC